MAELPGNIVQARESAQAAAGRAGELASQEFTIGDVLKQKTLDLYKNNQDIVQPLDVATSQYVTAPGEAREKYQDVFNPFSRENLVNQYTQNQALPMLSLSSVLGQRFGRVDDTIGAGTRAFQAQSAAQQAQAQQARYLYGDLLNEYTTTQDIGARDREEQFLREQFEWDKIFSEKELAQRDGGGGGGGGFPYYQPDYSDNEWEVVESEEVLGQPQTSVQPQMSTQPQMTMMPTSSPQPQAATRPYSSPLTSGLSGLGNLMDAYGTVTGIPGQISAAGQRISGAANTARGLYSLFNL